MAEPGTQLTLGIDIGGTSIKGALMEGEREVWTGRSGEYARPDRKELEDALEGLVREIPAGALVGVPTGQRGASRCGSCTTGTGTSH